MPDICNLLSRIKPSGSFGQPITEATRLQTSIPRADKQEQRDSKQPPFGFDQCHEHTFNLPFTQHLIHLRDLHLADFHSSAHRRFLADAKIDRTLANHSTGAEPADVLQSHGRTTTNGRVPSHGSSLLD